MTHIFWDRLASTPWWLYALFIYSLFIAKRATHPCTIKIKSIFFMPFIFLFASLTGLIFLVPLTVTNVSSWVVGVLSGILLGWLHFRVKNVRAIKEEGALYLPGSWSVVVLVILAFSWKMYSGFQLPMIDPRTLMQGEYASKLLALYGLLTGLFIGRVIYAIRCMKFGPYLIQPHP